VIPLVTDITSNHRLVSALWASTDTIHFVAVPDVVVVLCVIRVVVFPPLCSRRMTSFDSFPIVVIRIVKIIEKFGLLIDCQLGLANGSHVDITQVDSGAGTIRALIFSFGNVFVVCLLRRVFFVASGTLRSEVQLFLCGRRCRICRLLR
jgi:hypothetical protein